MKEMKNKKLAGIALVLCLVLAGGALTALISSIDSPSGGRLMLPEVEHECVFSLSTGTVSAVDDPDGKGYEYFACAECGEMRKIAGNHESGHYFRKLSDGSTFCACGAYLKLGSTTNVMKHDFSTLEGDDVYINALSQDVLVNGEFVVSLVNGQRGVLTQVGGNTFNEKLTSLASGVYEGRELDFVSFSFELHYTGDVSAITGGNFFNWRSFREDDGRYYDDLKFSLLPNAEGKLLVDDRFALEEDTVYTFTSLLNPITNDVTLYLNGGGYINTVICSGKAVYKVNKVWGVYFGRPQFYCADTSQFALCVDNIEAGYINEVVDTSLVNEVHECDHDFTVKGVVDYDHPASESWKKYTCKDCKRWYYGH